MKPAEIKSSNFAFAILVATLLAVFYLSLFVGIHYFAAPVSQFFFALGYKDRIKKPLVLGSIYTLFSIFVMYGLDLLILNKILAEIRNGFVDFFLTIFLSLIVVPYKFIGGKYEQLEAIAEKNSKYYDLVTKFPDLVCIKHHRRAVSETMLTYTSINCRMSEECILNKRMIKAGQIIGLIGKLQKPGKTGDNYYLTLWDHFTGEIMDADFDVIEIHDNYKMKNYDEAISRVVALFYNDLGRFKPLSEVKIKIMGNPSLSDSTKRLLKERFLAVDHFPWE